MKVGLLGGSFDPIHNGHLTLARAALEQLSLDRVYFVLSPLSPFKLTLPLTPASLRLRMLRLAIRGERKFKVGLWELKRKGPSYTLDTLQDFEKAHPNAEVYFIMGSDSLRSFPHWRGCKSIVRIAKLIVGLRPGALHVEPEEFLKGALITMSGRFPDISSVDLRSRLREGKPIGGLVRPLVEAFIRKSRIYEDPRRPS